MSHLVCSFGLNHFGFFVKANSVLFSHECQKWENCSPKKKVFSIFTAAVVDATEIKHSFHTSWWYFPKKQQLSLVWLLYTLIIHLSPEYKLCSFNIKPLPYTTIHRNNILLLQTIETPQISVYTNLSRCQRNCPKLLAYRIHRARKMKNLESKARFT